MKRREDWAEALAGYLDERRDVPFAWGENDCASFAAGAVQAMTGESLQIPQVESAAAYLHFLRDHGPLDAIVDDTLGERLPSPAFAQRGDVVLLFVDERATLGVCIGVEAAAPGQDGMLTVPMPTATAAWRV
ncbi:MAG: hypothetical protein O9345_15980 [Burkholderiaceae bacterium]|nr:hypothetical protein [Burkholderiaceae bacterium]